MAFADSGISRTVCSRYCARFDRVYNPAMFIRNGNPPFQFPVPFLRQPIAAGDAVRQMTQAVGVQPCTPCQQRQQQLNQRFQFVPMPPLFRGR
jgi:hypothetical protein